jgi:hypothetical protein
VVACVDYSEVSLGSAGLGLLALWRNWCAEFKIPQN